MHLVTLASAGHSHSRIPCCTLSTQTNHYVPDFKTAIDHFCIHAGGRAVIDGIEKNLNLLPQHTEPSKATLRDFGNTSSSSIWYAGRHLKPPPVCNKLNNTCTSL